MAVAVGFGSDPLRSHGSSLNVSQPFYPRYPGYFGRRPLVRPSIQGRRYPVGYCGTLGNFPFVVCGVDDEDELKSNNAGENNCRENDNDDKETQTNQENTTGEDLQSITSRTDVSESVGSRGEIWQQYACVWDRQQPRYNQFLAYEAQRKTKKPQDSEPSTTEKPDATQVASCLRWTCFKDPLTGREVRFTKPMVGYGGFVPRYPVLPRPQERCSNPGLISISRTTYKLYPSYEYRKQEFAHKGPLSSTVTTTPPFNPYNKIEKLSLDGKKLLWKRQNHIIKLVKMKKIYK